jgi:phage major head subunit gpT-like protein
MIINAANLAAVRTGFSTAYKQGLTQAKSQYGAITTTVPSSTKEQKYGWLGKIPKVREWLGPRAIQNLSQGDYAIKEKRWELTIAVDRDDIETDNIGVYAPMFEEMGLSAGGTWDELAFGLLKQGFTTNCYDGQFYFDIDHPVIDADGSTVLSIANTDGGTGTPWFLIDASRALKPIILQKRKDFKFVTKDDEKDDNVFDNNEFIYGADARANVGFGFWQFAWGSKQPLTPANYEIARAALMGMKGDHGKPLGIVPNLLVVPPTLESAGKKILASALVNGGESNPWAGSAELLVTPWLA